jgi:hypothetical protein
MIFVVLLLFVFVFDKLQQSRAAIREGLEVADTDSAYSSLEVKSRQLPEQAVASNQTVTNLKLMDYCIKGSYNTAYSGGYVTTDMVKYVLSRGCRFIDFEVYYLPPSNWTPKSDGETPPYDALVGYTADKLSYQPTIKNSTMPTFSTMLRTVLENGFVTKMSEENQVKNPEDPLFIQIRLKADNASKAKLFDKVQQILQGQLAESPYSYGNKQVSRFTKLSQIVKKLVVVFDSDDYYYVRKDGFNSSDYVNMLSNSESLKRIKYSEINTNKYKLVPPKTLTETTTDVADFKLLVPENDMKDVQTNPNPFIAIKSFGIQIVANQYYVADEHIVNTETMFSSRNGGIVPMSYCLSYINVTAEPSQTVTPPCI